MTVPGAASGPAAPAPGLLPEPPWANPAYAWYVVIVLFLAAIVSFVDRQIIALVVDDIKADLGLTDLHIGLLQGPPFGIFYALMSIPIALAADRYSRRNIIIAGVTFWSMATAACGLAGNFWHLFLARIGVGVGEATLSPSAYSMISDYFPKQKLALAMAVFTMGNLTGVGLAMVLGGMLIVWLKSIGPVDFPLFGTLQPWQLTFVMVGVPGLLLALLMLTIREPVRRGRSAATDESSKGQLAEFRVFLRAHRQTFTTLFASFTVLVLIAYGNFAWMIVFLVRTFGWTAGEAGLAYGMVVLVFGTSGAFFGGWLANVLARRGHTDAPYRATMLCTLPLAPFAALTFLAAPDGWWALALFAPWQFFGAVPAGLAGAAMMTITPNQMRAKISAVYLFFSNIIGLSLGPTVVGYLTTYVFRDDALIRYSLNLVNCVGPPIAVVLIWLGMSSFRDSVRRIEDEAATGSATTTN
jgi:MFS family permease